MTRRSSAFFRLACEYRLMRLSVVDDDLSVREALELVLDLNGFGVSTATDGLRRFARSRWIGPTR